MKNMLIIVEGIPGSGKTTTAQYIREWAAGRGLKPALYLEDAAYHPVDLDNLSYFEAQQYQDLLAAFPAYRAQLQAVSEKGTSGYFVHYRRWDEAAGAQMPAELAEVVFGHDAHDTLPPEQYLALLVERWKRFGAAEFDDDEVVIFECCLLQNPLTIFIGKHNYDADVVKTLIMELAACVESLAPQLILLQSGSVRDILQRVIAERPRAWIEFVEAYITGQGYGKAHGLRGLKGVTAFYEMFQAIEADLVSRLTWRKLILDVSGAAWDRYYREMAAFLAGSG